LANITLHEALSKFANPLPKSFITIEKIIAEQKLSVQLPYFILGTTYSMNSSYLKNIFQENGAQIQTLESTLIQAVDQLRIAYYQKPNPKMATEVFSRLADIEGIFIIACTELAMAYEDSEVKPPVLHLPKLQLRSLIDRAKH
jgi:aspartate/glutamate racemase